MTDSIEILVHTAAPSKAKDDERYRRQAQSFLSAFSGEPSSHAGLRRTMLAGEDDVVSDSGNVDLPSVSHVSQSMYEKPPSSANEPSQRSASQRSQHGISSESIQLPPLHTTNRHDSNKGLRPVANVKVVRTPFFEKYRRESGLTTILETEPRRRSSAPSSQEALTSVVPNSQPSDPALRHRGAIRKAGPLVQDQSDSPSFKRRRLNTFVPETRFQAEAPPALKSYDAAKVIPSSQQTATLPSSPLPPGRPSPPIPPTSSFQPPSSPPHSTTTNIRTIHPPLPPTDTSLLDSQMTKPLRLAAGQVLGHYQPIAQTRPTHPLERGYWSLRVGGDNWSAADIAKFWEFVSQFVREGRAGWGTWAEVEDWGHEERLKLWCWGEVVKEVWLMLFVGSARKVKGRDGMWIDAEGETVIAME